MMRSLSEALFWLDLRGLSWCLVEIGPSGGFSIPQGELIYFYAALEGPVRISGAHGMRVDLEPGDVAIVVSGDAHSVRNHQASECVIIDFFRNGEYSDIPRYIRLGSDGQIANRLLCGRLKVWWPNGLSQKDFPHALKLDASETMIDRASLEKAASGPGSAITLTRIATLMLTLSLRADPHTEQLLIGSNSNDPIARAVQIVDRHPDRPWTVPHLAQYVGMGRSNFAARFLAEKGCTPMEAVTERRMLLALTLLRESDLKIAEVGLRVGYISEAAFSRRFARFFGISPGQARSNNKVSPTAEGRAETGSRSRPRRDHGRRATVPAELRQRDDKRPESRIDNA